MICFFENNFDKQNRCLYKLIKINDFNINYKFENFVEKKKLKIIMIIRNFEN